ncbi:MAG: hypothetical protein M1821_004091 [Bathelium mastoideum]|nr:MAG: hypothetical protein M1821_004091 [Bathelium mastoideum]
MELLSKGIISTVDLSPFTSNSELAVRKAAARELARCCRPHGCVGIVGHGVPRDLLAEAFRVAKTLFDLPMEDKMKAPHPKARIPHRGYSAPGREKAFSDEEVSTNSEAVVQAKRQILDLHETYECGDESNPVQTNIWLPEEILPGFRQFSMTLFWRLHDCARLVLEALMMSLDLTEEECNFLRKLHPGYSEQLRYAHYPAAPIDALMRGELNRFTAHTDLTSFTLLFQDGTGGLEFKNIENGNFMPATPADGKMYLNIGDWFMRMTNGLYPASEHRVSISQNAVVEASQMTAPRYSIPFFFSPHADMVAGPLPTCVTEQNPAKFKHVKVWDYAAERLKWQYETSKTEKK